MRRKRGHDRSRRSSEFPKFGLHTQMPQGSGWGVLWGKNESSMAATLLQSWSKKAPSTPCAHRLRGATGSLRGLSFIFSLGKSSKPNLSSSLTTVMPGEVPFSARQSEYTWFSLSIPHTHTYLIPCHTHTHTHRHTWFRLSLSHTHTHTWFYHTPTYLIPSHTHTHTHTCLHQRVISVCLSLLMLLSQKYYRLGGSNSKHLFLKVLEAGKSKIWVLTVMRVHFPVHGSLLLTVTHTARRGPGSLEGHWSHVRALSPSSHHLPEAQPPNTTTLTDEFWGLTDIVYSRSLKKWNDTFFML